MHNLRKCVAHHAREIIDQFVKKRFFLSEFVAVAHRATGDTSQHIAASGVFRNHAIANQKGTGADVIGNHAQRRMHQIRRAGFARGRFDQRLKQIDFVIGVHVLQHRRQPLQPHAGIDGRLRQRNHRAIRDLAVELHKNEVPDFDKTIAVFAGRAGRSAGNVCAVIVKNFAARATGTGIAHHPEIIGREFGTFVIANANDPLFRHANFVRPEVVGLVVVCIHRHQQTILRQLVNVGQQLPCKLDRIFLEIIAETEIAEHLKKRVVASGVTNIFKIVMFAAGAYTALRCDRAYISALFLAEKTILELIHAGIGEQQRRIVARHERT